MLRAMKEVISTKNAPAAIGAYSQAIKANGFIFVSGSLGLDPVSGQLCSQHVGEQADQALKNIKAVLEAAGSTMENVVKCTVLLADIQDFGAVNEIYSRYFPTNPPARAAYAVAALPRAARVEIEAIAVSGDAAGAAPATL